MALRLLAAAVLLLCCLDRATAYSIPSFEQTITVSQCNVSVAEVIMVQPDLDENITMFTRDVFLPHNWEFVDVPSARLSPAQDVTFSTKESLITIDFNVPPTSPFNISISYSFTNLILSANGPNGTTVNSFQWTLPSTNVTGTDIFFFLAVFKDTEEATATIPGMAEPIVGSEVENDTFIAYSQDPPVGGTVISFDFRSDAVCIVVRHSKDLAAGAVVGIVFGTLTGTVMLLVVLNLICGYFSPAPPRLN